MKSDTLVISSHPPAWQALAEITGKSHYDWCARHGYDYYLDCSDLQDNYWNPVTRGIERRPIKGFIKLDLFLHYLPRYRRVIWLDADLLVTERSRTVETFTCQRPGARVIVPFDWNGHNATVIIAQSTDEVWDFFWACNNTGRKLFLGHDWVEMEAMRYFAQTPPYDRGFMQHLSIKELCPILWEQYEPHGVPSRVSAKYGWQRGDFALHLSALPLDTRIVLARQYAAELGL